MNELADLVAGLRRCIIENDGAIDFATLEVTDLEKLLDAAEALIRTETCLRCDRQGASGRLLEIIDRALYSISMRNDNDSTN
jgi:hypothetical protein